MLTSCIFELCARFCDGCQSDGDDVHIAMPHTAMTADIKRVLEDRYMRLQLSLSVISAKNIIHEHLTYSKVSARWIPTQLIGFSKMSSFSRIMCPFGRLIKPHRKLPRWVLSSDTSAIQPRSGTKRFPLVWASKNHLEVELNL